MCKAVTDVSAIDQARFKPSPIGRTNLSHADCARLSHVESWIGLVFVASLPAGVELARPAAYQYIKERAESTR